MKNLILALAVGFAASTSAFAALNANVLMDRNFARQSRNQKFLSQVELGHAQIANSRAEFVYDTNRRLHGSNAVSGFEYSHSVAVLISTRFDLIRATFHLAQAETNEKIWTLRAESAVSGKESAREIALLYQKLAENRLKLIETLASEAVPFAKELNFIFEHTRSLVPTGAADKDELNRVELAATEARGLVELANAEVIDARQQLAEARKDVEQAAVASDRK